MYAKGRIAGTFSWCSKLLESRICVVSNVREMCIRGFAKQLAERELMQSELLRIENVIKHDEY